MDAIELECLDLLRELGVPSISDVPLPSPLAPSASFNTHQSAAASSVVSPAEEEEEERKKVEDWLSSTTENAPLSAISTSSAPSRPSTAASDRLPISPTSNRAALWTRVPSGAFVPPARNDSVPQSIESSFAFADPRVRNPPSLSPAISSSAALPYTSNRLGTGPRIGLSSTIASTVNNIISANPPVSPKKLKVPAEKPRPKLALPPAIDLLPLVAMPLVSPPRPPVILLDPKVLLMENVFFCQYFGTRLIWMLEMGPCLSCIEERFTLFFVHLIKSNVPLSDQIQYYIFNTLLGHFFPPLLLRRLLPQWYLPIPSLMLVLALPAHTSTSVPIASMLAFWLICRIPFFGIGNFAWGGSMWWYGCRSIVDATIPACGICSAKAERGKDERKRREAMEEMVKERERRDRALAVEREEMEKQAAREEEERERKREEAATAGMGPTRKRLRQQARLQSASQGGSR